MTIDTLLHSDLWRDFEKAVRSSKKQPADVLAELIAEYIETETDAALYEAIAAETQASGYTEDDTVELVRTYRRSPPK